MLDEPVRPEFSSAVLDSQQKIGRAPDYYRPHSVTWRKILELGQVYSERERGRKVLCTGPI